MDSNLIVIYNEKKYFLNSFDDIVQLFFGDDYLNLSFDEKFKIRYQKAFGFTIKNNLELVDTRIGLLGSNGQLKSKEYDFSKAFIIDNEKTFILSMCKFDTLLLLENLNSNIFYIPGIGKIENNDNYIVINKIVNELMLLNLKI